MCAFKSPTTIAISGSTGSGKTYFVKELLENKDSMFSLPVSKVFYFYNVWQHLYDEIENNESIEFHEGIPEEEQLNNMDKESHSILILDDLQHLIVKNKLCERLFTQLSHHNLITVIYIIQNMYYPGLRTLSLNTHYNIMFKNMRDIGQIRTLAKQTGLGNNLVNAYRDATKNPYGYICLDLNPHTLDDTYRITKDILPHQYTIVYQ